MAMARVERFGSFSYSPMRNTSLLVVATFVFCMACSGCTTRELDQCQDSACMTAWIDLHWPDDPDRVIAAVVKTTDPVIRATLITHMGENYPGSAKDLCDWMPAGLERERCITINNRPHLWQIDGASPETGPKGSGQVFSMLTSDLSSFNDPWLQLAPKIAACPDTDNVNTCQTNAALVAAERGQLDAAGGACLGIEDEKWRFECFFLASERAVGSRAGTADAARLCLGSGYFNYRCLGHLATTTGKRAPLAGGGSVAQWSGLNEDVLGMSEEIGKHSPELADRCVQLAFSSAMIRAYWSDGLLVGIPQELLDERVLPHARAMIAWRLWQDEALEHRSLEQWGERVEKVLVSRGTSDERTIGHDSTPSRAANGGFEHELAGEEDIPWVAYLEVTRRATAADPLHDAMICVLEAAAKTKQTTTRGLFAEALQHECREVRWTAARLASELVPGALGSVGVGGETDPLVRARIDEGRHKVPNKVPPNPPKKVPDIKDQE